MKKVGSYPSPYGDSSPNTEKLIEINDGSDKINHCDTGHLALLREDPIQLFSAIKHREKHNSLSKNRQMQESEQKKIKLL